MAVHRALDRRVLEVALDDVAVEVCHVARRAFVIHAAVLPGEVLVAISRGGLSEEVNLLVGIARARGLATTGLLHDDASPLAKLCDLVIAVRTPPELELGGYCATTSSLAASAAGDALCALVLQITGYTPSQLATTHPRGAVGKALGSDPATP